jgi:hypothetical protein
VETAAPLAGSERDVFFHRSIDTIYAIELVSNVTSTYFVLRFEKCSHLRKSNTNYLTTIHATTIMEKTWIDRYKICFRVLQDSRDIDKDGNLSRSSIPVEQALGARVSKVQKELRELKQIKQTL